MASFQLTDDGLGAEVLRHYVDDAGRPQRARVMYWRAGADDDGAVTFEDAPAGTWWVSDTDVPESVRITKAEHDELANELAQESLHRQAEETAARERAATQVRIARERARDELIGLGLSDATVKLLMGKIPGANEDRIA